MSENPTLRERVAGEIRAHLGRRNLTATELARRTGMTQAYVARRMLGDVSWSVDDLERIAHVLGVDVFDLFPSDRSTAPAAAPTRERVLNRRQKSGEVTKRYRRAPERPSGTRPNGPAGTRPTPDHPPNGRGAAADPPPDGGGVASAPRDDRRTGRTRRPRG